MFNIEFELIKPYIIEKNKIGKGTYGTVYKGKFDNENVAIKKVNISDRVKVEREKDILDDIEHDHIIRIIAEATESPPSKTIYLVLEYMAGDTLHKLVHDLTKRYNFVDVMNWFCQAAKALHYLHTRTPPIIHRDVKPSNMLLDESGQTLKFCDFGKSREYKTEMTKKAGTGLYMAPEVFAGTDYTTPADIFSLIISLAETLKRKHPYEHLKKEKLSELELTKKICHDIKIRPVIGNDITKEVRSTKEVRELMTRGWNPIAENRPTAQELVNCFESEYHKEKQLLSSKNAV